jgi:hypothetical protein
LPAFGVRHRSGRTRRAALDTSAFAARHALDRVEAELKPNRLAAARETSAAATLEDFEMTAQQLV